MTTNRIFNGRCRSLFVVVVKVHVARQSGVLAESSGRDTQHEEQCQRRREAREAALASLKRTILSRQDWRRLSSRPRTVKVLAVRPSNRGRAGRGASAASPTPVRR
jgi:hypothetical protein